MEEIAREVWVWISRQVPQNDFMTFECAGDNGGISQRSRVFWRVVVSSHCYRNDGYSTCTILPYTIANNG